MTHTMTAPMQTPKGHVLREVRNNHPEALASVWLTEDGRMQVTVFRDGRAATIDYRPGVHMYDFIKHHTSSGAAVDYLDQQLSAREHLSEGWKPIGIASR